MITKPVSSFRLSQMGKGEHLVPQNYGRGENAPFSVGPGCVSHPPSPCPHFREEYASFIGKPWSKGLCEKLLTLGFSLGEVCSLHRQTHASETRAGPFLPMGRERRQGHKSAQTLSTHGAQGWREPPKADQIPLQNCSPSGQTLNLFLPCLNLKGSISTLGT